MEERAEKLYNDYKSLTKSEKIEFFSIIEEDSKLIREEIELEKMRFELFYLSRSIDLRYPLI